MILVYKPMYQYLPLQRRMSIWQEIGLPNPLYPCNSIYRKIVPKSNGRSFYLFTMGETEFRLSRFICIEMRVPVVNPFVLVYYAWE